MIAGYGNIMYIIGYTCSLIEEKLTPIFIKIDKEKSEKTYHDALIAINNFNFGNFNISLLTNENIFKDAKLLSDINELNKDLHETFIINKRINNTYNFFNSKTMLPCKNLPISFKNLKENKNKFYKIFPQIRKNEEYITINVRRGEKLKFSNYLIVPAKIYDTIIQQNLNKKIIFVSDDIQWCKENFSKYQNVLFNEYIGNDKIIIDQFILFNSTSLICNLYCTFSHIPIILNKNKIKNVYILIKKSLYENELNEVNSRTNIFKNDFHKNIKLIGV